MLKDNLISDKIVRSDTGKRKPDTARDSTGKNEQRPLPAEGSLFNEAEIHFAKDHLARIKQLAIKPQDIVLIAIPMREQSWLLVTDACIYAGASFILTDAEPQAAILANKIIEEKVTVVATMPQVWGQLSRELKSKFRKIQTWDMNDIRVILLNDREELQPGHSMDSGKLPEK